MQREDFKDLDIDLHVVVDEDLHELRQHGNDEYPIGIYNINVKEKHMEIVPWHWHEELELIYVTEGCGEFLVSENSFFLEKGQALLINTGVLHSFHIAPSVENCIFVSIVFSPSFLVSPESEGLWKEYICPIIDNTDFCGLSIVDSNEIETLNLDRITTIYNQYKSKSFGYEIFTKEFLLTAWMAFLKHAMEDTPTNHIRLNAKMSTDEARTKDAIQFIKDHFTEPITLDEIAASVHISKSECCRCVKRCMNMTPFEYLMKYRILTAAKMLSDSTNHISFADIATSVGFNSSSYFNKLFRKYMGCTPSQYKKKTRK